MIDWAEIKTTRDELETISTIAKRAKKMHTELAGGGTLDVMSLMMDIEATHAKYPLRLDDLMSANDLEFGHDVFGIRSHINRETGELMDCFIPRHTIDCLLFNY